MNHGSSDMGPKAISSAKLYLEMRGFLVLELNWRRPRYEIDIVAQKDGVMHFVEVTYYKALEPGDMPASITPAKLALLKNAALLWIEENEYPGRFSLSSVEIDSQTLAVMNFMAGSY